jgi:putative membrane protein
MALLTQAERERIAATIAEVEQRTAAELVVVTVEHSDEYNEVRFAYALAAALLGGALGHWGWPQLSVVALLRWQCGAALAAYLLVGLTPLLRLLTPKGLKRGRVERRARLAFLDHAVFATRDRNGVLIMVSELERHVVILGDEGIHARVQIEGWRAHVAHVVAAIRSGRAGEGLCEVVRALGEVLTANFPVRPDDTNELPNDVQQEPR